MYTLLTPISQNAKSLDTVASRLLCLALKPAITSISERLFILPTVKMESFLILPVGRSGTSRASTRPFREAMKSLKELTSLSAHAGSSANIGCLELLNQLKSSLFANRSEEHTSELQSHSDLHSFPTRRSSDLEIPQRINVPFCPRWKLRQYRMLGIAEPAQIITLRQFFPPLSFIITSFCINLSLLMVYID